MMEASKPRKSSVHFRLDDELADLIDRDAQRLRLSRSDVCRQALIERFERKERAVA
jgi:predicted transcriptional regulator